MIELNNAKKTWIAVLLCAVNGLYFLSRYGSGDLRFSRGVMFDFELPKVICFSPSEIATPVGQLFFSTLVILFVCTICHQARKAVDEYVNDPLIRILSREALAAADLCGCCFELIIVADNFGVWMYALYLFCLTIWWTRAWGEASACPYTHLEDVVLGKQDSQLAMMKTWAELTGGIFVFKLTQFIWNLEIVETHENRAEEQCTADLQVPMWLGCVIEGSATCLCQIAAKAIADLEPKRGDIIGSFVGTSLVVAAFDYTGGYFNPVLATSLKFGCKGNTFTEHVVVYWVGACLGSVLSVFLYHHTALGAVVRKLGKFGTAEGEEEEEDHEKEE